MISKNNPHWFDDMTYGPTHIGNNIYMMSEVEKEEDEVDKEKGPVASLGHLLYLNENPVGHLRFNINEDKKRLNILNIKIDDPNLWDKGHGYNYLDLLLKEAKKAGCKEAYSDWVSDDNIRSIKLMKKLGFKKVAEETWCKKI